MDQEDKQDSQTHQSSSIVNSGPHRSDVRHLAVFDQSSRCYGVAMVSGRLYLSNASQNVVDVVDATTGARLSRFGADSEQNPSPVDQSSQVKFSCPWGVAVDEARDRLYVADRDKHRVVVLRLSDGSIEAVWGTVRDRLHYPAGLALSTSSGLLYVADWGNHCVKGLRVSDGQCAQVLGTGKGSGDHQMNYPQGVAVCGEFVYVADTDNRRVLVYSQQNGRFLRQLVRRATGEMPLYHPTGLSVDREARLLFVADYEKSRVCVYDTLHGDCLRHFDVVTSDNNPANPLGVMWDATRCMLYVTLFNATLLCTYKYEGCLDRFVWNVHDDELRIDL
eukprot:TRINITY_DN8202_c0_g5_i4.p1 TRINITY_DN8202_c0_g5~~TRINITY_DN8202_c0_g5_i4.p1  ORF type:complete len:361 (-),score=46.86 TRINITY_DN8202_c0_g5_i4:9-1010(-)